MKLWVAINWLRGGSNGDDDDETLGSTKEEYFLRP
jgi:hypothetical protein